MKTVKMCVDRGISICANLYSSISPLSEMSLLPMILILDGCSEYNAHASRKIGLH